MIFDLVVISPFESWRVGDHITDDVLVAKVVAAHPHQVVKIARVQPSKGTVSSPSKIEKE